MLKYILFMSLLATTTIARAEVPPDYELRFGPSQLGYSNFSGFHYGLDVSFARSLDEHWQLQLGGSTSTRSHGTETYFSLNTGARYNFGEDFTRAFFVGGGVEWGDEYSLGTRAHEKAFAGYAEFGKRFRLNDSGSWSYTPFAMLTSRGDGGILRIEPISFSYSF